MEFCRIYDNTEPVDVIRSSLFFFPCKNCRRLHSIYCRFHHVITKPLPSYHCSSSVHVALCAFTSSFTWFSPFGVVTVFICPLFWKESCFPFTERIHRSKPRCTPFVIDLWPRKPRLAALVFRVGFVVDIVAFGQVFLRAFWLFRVCYHSTRHWDVYRDGISNDTVWNNLKPKIQKLHPFMGTAVAQWLRCCDRNRKVAGSIPAGGSGFFSDIISFRSHYGPGVESASNRNE